MQKELNTSSQNDFSEVKVSVDQLVYDNADSELLEEFKCKICLVNLVGCGPRLTRCSHLFCGDCIEQWFTAHPSNKTWAQRAKDGASVPCPVCKEPLLKEQDLHPVGPNGDGGSKILYQMLSNTQIVCANHPTCNSDGKCTWSGEYGSYQDHIRCCQNVPMQVNDAAVSPEQANIEPEETFIDTLAENFQAQQIESDVAEEAVNAPAPIDEQPTTPSSDLHLTELIGSLLELKPGSKAPESEAEDARSTDASDDAGLVESSDAETVEHAEAVSAEGNLDISPETRETQAKTAAKSPKATKNPAKKDVSKEAVAKQQAQMTKAAQAMQWQMAQYQQAAQAQAAYWQIAQAQQMAQAQAFQAQVAQWQQAQMAQANYAAQMHSRQAYQMAKAHANSTEHE